MTRVTRQKQTKGITPEKHGKRWRIRWTDAFGRRMTEYYDDKKIAQVMGDKYRQEVRECKLGIRIGMVIANKSFSDLCDLWIKAYIQDKKSKKDILSIIAVSI